MPTVGVRLDDLRRTGRVRVDGPAGAALVVWTGGRVYALDDACPHRGLSMSEGAIRECVITCPAHLWRFDLGSGSRRDDPNGQPIAVYPNRIVSSPDGEVVEIDLPDPLPALSLREVLLAHAGGSQ